MKYALVIAMLALSMTTNSAAAKVMRGPASQTQVAPASGTLSDVVKKLRDDDEGVVVLFEKTKGSYYLKRDVATFDILRKNLEESLKSKKPVSVTFDPALLNILEVK